MIRFHMIPVWVIDVKKNEAFKMFELLRERFCLLEFDNAILIRHVMQTSDTLHVCMIMHHVYLL